MSGDTFTLDDLNGIVDLVKRLSRGSTSSCLTAWSDGPRERAMESSAS